MTDAIPLKRIFEVARILKISTPEIIDYLTELGYDVTRKQMQPVSEPMYIALLHKFDRGNFENYLIEHGVVGEELRRLTLLLDEQKKKASKPVEAPRPAEPTKPERFRAPRKIRLHTEKSETIKVTFFRRELPTPPPPKVNGIGAVRLSLFARVGEQPQAIPTSPLGLQLIQLVLALPHPAKETLLADLRIRDPR